MRWSQLKKRTESNFAESVAGRVEVWTTRYRGADDAEGEGWVTIDKQRIISMGTYTSFARSPHSIDDSVSAGVVPLRNLINTPLCRPFTDSDVKPKDSRSHDKPDLFPTGAVVAAPRADRVEAGEFKLLEEVRVAFCPFP